MIEFIINNLAVLLILLAIVGVLGFYWVCHQVANNTTKLMASYCGDPYDTHAMSHYKPKVNSVANVANGLAQH